MFTDKPYFRESGAYLPAKMNERPLLGEYFVTVSTSPLLLTLALIVVLPSNVKTKPAPPDTETFLLSCGSHCQGITDFVVSMSLKHLEAFGDKQRCKHTTVRHPQTNIWSLDVVLSDLHSKGCRTLVSGCFELKFLCCWEHPKLDLSVRNTCERQSSVDILNGLEI